MTEFLSHELHVGIYVLEEQPEPRTQVVQPVFAARCAEETMLRTAPVASEPNFALAAVTGKGVPLLQAKPALLTGTSQGFQRPDQDIAQPVLGIDKVIA